jgi:hypothetical protein
MREQSNHPLENLDNATNFHFYFHFGIFLGSFILFLGSLVLWLLFFLGSLSV